MTWRVEYLSEAIRDFAALDGSRKILVRKALRKISQNPLPHSEGGAMASRWEIGEIVNLPTFLKIKLRGAGIRVLYKLLRTETAMLVIVIGMRRDEEVYDLAQKRTVQYGL